MEIKSRLHDVEAKLAKAAEKAGKKREDIKLLAVTKTHNVDEIKTGIEAGIEYIGENKVQEAADKLPLLKAAYKEFHFIGHLQTNKINKLLRLRPALIHSIDNLHLVEQLNSKCAKMSINQEILLQVNTSGEESKFGVSPEDALELAAAIRECDNLILKGLMTIGRFTQDERALRESFSCLRELKELIKSNYPDLDLKWLSMGMSNDFEIAIEEGANLVRLGTVIFGQRACALEKK